MRLLFFGDGSWSSESLFRLAELGFEIPAVIIRRQPTDDSLKKAADQLKIPVFQPSNANDQKFVQEVRSLNVDLNVSVSYDQIIRKPLIESTRLGFVNFHAGKLPYYRGRSVINWALINGESELGLTGHFIDEGIDTGDIIYQTTLSIDWRDTYRTVMERCIAAFPNLVVTTLIKLRDGNYQRIKQSDFIGSYFPRRMPGDEWIDWKDTSRNIYNKIRAISAPGPGARTCLGDDVLTLWKAYYDPEWPKYIGIPGSVVSTTKEGGVYVKTSDSIVLLEEVEVPRSDLRLKIGTRFSSPH